ncbi:MAG TPA: glycerol kinase GlpK [Acidimicrobiales bacterium]|nr:glycerol kinase GlpK [Acidimicrobiales bacterium]
MGCVIAVDAGTSSVRALAVAEDGAVVDVAQRQLTQYFPRPGWMEHDATEIWGHALATVAEVATRRAEAGEAVAAIGITNQRETVVAWDRARGTVLHRAIVWQDRRTAGRCEELRALGHLPTVRASTGLVLDPYFSATKMAWLLGPGGVPPGPALALGTVDAWLVWNLTGGTEGGVVATDVTNASRTSLLDIGARAWSDELCDLFGVPMGALPAVHPSCGRLGLVGGALARAAPGLAGVPVSGVAGDQQAALFGQACLHPGMAKATYGTGTFVLVNAGPRCPAPQEGLLTTVAWDLGEHGGPDPVAYALEGAIFVTGAAVQWLRDGLGLIDSAAAVGPLAAGVADTEGVYVVPAFTGLGSPWWDPYARGTIVGLTRGTGAAHIARAVVEATAYQVRDVVGAMRRAGTELATVRVDGGMAVLDLLLQLQADQLRVAVCRPTTTETTALGAATLAGLAEGVWSTPAELETLWHLDAGVEPVAGAVAADRGYDGWRLAVERSLGWAAPRP